ncbi:TetR/AcrR family transcriptional regulator [Paenibacillus sp. GCM10027627]|uniref:TetR/AcrR family transcriptional regulator n=1 Tax=unclassified Paenibacillus TaxID=185978 RepID=UPI0036445EA7
MIIPKIVDHEQFRLELLDRCFALFASKSFSSLTMREIAKQLGVSTGTIYHYFPDKHELFKQMVQHLTVKDIMLGTIDLTGYSTEDKVRHLFRYLLDQESYFIHKTLLMIEYFRSTELEPEHKAMMQETETRYLTVLSQILPAPEDVAFLFALIHGLLIMRYLGGGTSMLEAHMEIAIEWVLSRENKYREPMAT